MKANEPDKIYVHVRYKPCEITFSEVKEEGVSNVEYARTDAFIKKACNAYCKVCKMPNCRRDECKFIEGFRKYMEGD